MLDEEHPLLTLVRASPVHRTAAQLPLIVGVPTIRAHLLDPFHPSTIARHCYIHTLQPMFRAALEAQACHLTATSRQRFASLANLELLVVIAMKVRQWMVSVVHGGWAGGEPSVVDERKIPRSITHTPLPLIPNTHSGWRTAGESAARWT